MECQQQIFCSVVSINSAKFLMSRFQIKSLFLLKQLMLHWPQGHQQDYSRVTSLIVSATAVADLPLNPQTENSGSMEMEILGEGD